MLTDKSAQLARLPKRADFPSETVCFIKQKLGPWPRALEAAGLKAKSACTRAENGKKKKKAAKSLPDISPSANREAADDV